MSNFKPLLTAVFFMGSLVCLCSPVKADQNPFQFHFSSLIGYDNNTALDSSRKGDAFTEESGGVNFRRRLDDQVQLRLSYRALNINYFKATDNDIFLNDAGAGLDFLLSPTTLLETDYSFEFADFTHDSSVTSFLNEGRVGLKQKIGERVIVKAGFSAGVRDYEEGKLTQADGVLSSADERSDGRDVFDSEVSYEWSRSILLRAGYFYTRNDSNDQFHDYYDYEASKYYVGASLKWTPRISSTFRFSYERRNYDSRPILSDAGVFENDDYYTSTNGLFYKINENLSLGAVYAYRQKNSNEPSQKYSGSISTLGLYYSF